MKSPFKLSVLILLSLFCSCKPKPHDPLAGSSRKDKNGWVYVHLEGSPHDIGYQHGYLLSKEIDTMIKVLQYYVPYSSKHDWAFYRATSARLFWNKIDKQYQEEMKGITEGLGMCLSLTNYYTAS